MSQLNKVLSNIVQLIIEDNNDELFLVARRASGIDMTAEDSHGDKNNIRLNEITYELFGLSAGIGGHIR